MPAIKMRQSAKKDILFFQTFTEEQVREGGVGGSKIFISMPSKSRSINQSAKLVLVEHIKYYTIKMRILKHLC